MSLSSCYVVCNNWMLQYQQSGITSNFCPPIGGGGGGGDFLETLDDCSYCVQAYAGSDGSPISGFLQNFFQTGIDYCNYLAEIGQEEGGNEPPGTSSLFPYNPSCGTFTAPPSTSSSALPSVTTSVASTYSFGFWLSYTYSICPTRTFNSVYPTDCNLPVNHLWGCSPGYLCQPPKVACDMDMGPPAPSFTCAPSDCLPAPPLAISTTGMVTATLATTITPQASTTTATVSTITFTEFPISSPLPLQTGYFNLDPALFDLDWGVFVGDVSITSFSSTPSITGSHTSSSSVSIPTKTPSTTPGTKSSAWIAGPVIGALVVVALASLAIFLFMRRQRRRKMGTIDELGEKPQLDGTEVKPKEIGGAEVGEMDGAGAKPQEPQEMDAGYRGEEVHDLASGEERGQEAP